MRRGLMVLTGLLVALAAGLLLPNYLPRHWVWPGSILLVAGAWLAQPWLRQSWLPDVGLAYFTILAGVALLLGRPPAWMLLVLLASLVAWDLSRFLADLAAAPDVRDEADVVRRRLARLGLVLLAGGGPALLAMQVPLTLSLVPALILGVLAVLGLARLLRWNQG